MAPNVVHAGVKQGAEQLKLAIPASNFGKAGQDGLDEVGQLGCYLGVRGGVRVDLAVCCWACITRREAVQLQEWDGARGHTKHGMSAAVIPYPPDSTRPWQAAKHRCSNIALR